VKLAWVHLTTKQAMDKNEYLYTKWRTKMTFEEIIKTTLAGETQK